MKKRFYTGVCSPWSFDISDARALATTGVILGSVLLIVGLLMLVPPGPPSSFSAAMNLLFLMIGTLMAILGLFCLRRTKHQAVALSAEESRLEWRRFFIAASVYVAISLVMIVLNIRFDLIVGFPLAILGIFIFWLFVLGKRRDQDPGPRTKRSL